MISSDHLIFFCLSLFFYQASDTGEFPSLLFIQLIEMCPVQWYRVLREYIEICDLLEDVWEQAEFCE